MAVSSVAHIAVIGIGALVFAVMPSRPAYAQSCAPEQCRAIKVYGDSEAARCRAWATEAVGHQLENEQVNCKFTGADWHFDIKLHYRICRGLSQLDRDQFAATRRKKMADCRSANNSDEAATTTPEQQTPVPDAVGSTEDKSADQSDADKKWDAYCQKSYLVDALRIARVAKDWNCSGADPELHRSRQKHYDFCIRESPNGSGDYPLHHLITERQKKIKECQEKSATKKPIDRETRIRRRACSNYADIFLNAQLENVRLSCGQSGSDWHSDWNKHYKACTKLERGERLGNMHDRQTVMRDCRAKVFPKDQLAGDDPPPEDASEKKVDPAGVTEGVRKACRTFAQDGVAHQAANQQLGCGFTGALWNINEQAHYEACVARRADYSFRSHIARDAKLRQCTAVRLCQDPERAKTVFCQDLTGLVPPDSQGDQNENDD